MSLIHVSDELQTAFLTGHEFGSQLMGSDGSKPQWKSTGRDLDEEHTAIYENCWLPHKSARLRFTLSVAVAPVRDWTNKMA